MKDKKESIRKNEFTSPTHAVRITETYRPGMTTAQIYDCARWAWDADLKRASRCQLVLAVYGGRVVGAFKPERWDVATNINPPRGKSADVIKQDIKEGRVAFEGVDVSQSSPFVGRSFTMGQNPIKYEGEVPRKRRPKALI